MTPERELRERITDYLSTGGLFNPEMAKHQRVRDLLIDCREAFIAVLEIVRHMPHSMHDLACKRSHSPVAEDAIPGTPSVCPCYRCRLEKLLIPLMDGELKGSQPRPQLPCERRRSESEG